jgi:hypothetical protein
MSYLGNFDTISVEKIAFVLSKYLFMADKSFCGTSGAICPYKVRLKLALTDLRLSCTNSVGV